MPYLKIYGVKMYIHDRYDTLQKLVLILFAQELLLAMGDTRKVIGFYPTELIIPTFQKKLMDGVLELQDGTLLNIEFQTGNLDDEFLLRCAQYAVNLRVISRRYVETIVISTGLREKSKSSVLISKSTKLEFKTFFYSEFDGLKKLNIIKDKIENNEKLTDNDHYDLIFIPVMGNVNRVETAFEVFEIANNDKIFTQDEQSKIKQCQFVVADIISNGNKELFQEFLEVIDMNTNYLIEYERKLVESSREEGREEGIKEGIKEGREEGIKEGIKKNSKNVVRNMKGKYSDEEISDVTGLSIKEINAI